MMPASSIVPKPVVAAAGPAALVLIAVLAVLVPFACHAADSAGDQAPANKLTVGLYRFADSGDAIDVNLRNTGDYGDVWLGWYESRSRDERQVRLGWDRTWDWGLVRVLPAAQVASYGYLAGSIGIETGSPWFVGAGFGRTNLRPNWNLNFDPNDSWTASAGYRNDTQSIALTWIRDDRQNPDQRHIHLTWRNRFANGDRLTLDVLHKRGLVEGTEIHRTGASLTWDWPRWFVRLAWDPNVNFTPESMWRVAVGTRF